MNEFADGWFWLFAAVMLATTAFLLWWMGEFDWEPR
jgi:hypothetical protein